MIDPKNGRSFPRVDCLHSLETATAGLPTTTSTSTSTTTSLPPLCGPTPDAGCRGADSGRASLKVRDAAVDRRDRLAWKWRGAATASADLLDPAANGALRYALCVYDRSAASQPLMEANVAGSGVCRVTMSVNRVVAARFIKGSFTITIASGTTGSGSGRVTSQAGLTPAINCTITNGTPAATGCSAKYPASTVVTLTATPATGFVFRVMRLGSVATGAEVVWIAK